jgi:bleomycin hydrolase
MKKSLLIIVSFLFVTMSYAQNGSITPDVLKKLEKSVSFDANDKARMNALSSNNIKDISLNRENVGKVDHNFKYSVEVSGITDQKSSGRCWMFTSLNMLRPKVMEKYNISSFEFSENYLYFYDQLEKANLFLETVLKYADKPMDDKYNEWLFKSPIGDGGVWNSFTNLVGKYGLVPKSVMPETNSSSNTGWLRRMIKRKLREDGLMLRTLSEKSSPEQLQEKKTIMLADIYKMLVYNLGQPPQTFEWRFKDKDGTLSEYKEYTPISFKDEVVGNINFDDYVLLMNDPSREYFKLYEIEYDRNVVEGKNWLYINLPADDIKKFAVESIKNNEAMYASCDVGKQLYKDGGTLDIDNYDFESLYDVKFGMSKADRIRSFDSGSTHGMALVAVDVDKKEVPTKWRFENSWGASNGDNGYLTYTDEWFNEYMFRVVVLKQFVSDEILKILKDEPILLPPWDPMFSEDM